MNIAKPVGRFVLGAGSALLVAAGGCDAYAGADRPAAAAAPVDAPLAPFRGDLLELAFETASSIPVQPHIKSRSRAQEAVVSACLGLDQPVRAAGYVERIDSWRRGVGYGDLALYCARNGHAGEARRYAELAARISESAEDWRRDSIRVRVARVHAWLGQMQEADRFEQGVVESETGKVAGVKAIADDGQRFDEQMRVLEQLVASGNFDVTRNVLESCAELYDRFYDDAPRRSALEVTIRSSWSNMQGFIRIDLLLRLADSALDHGDRTRALELVEEAQAFFDGAVWPLEHRIPRAAKIAAMRSRAGDPERARRDLDQALALFDAEGDRIVDIYRARALRPLAEAFRSAGDTEAAHAVYARAVDAGVVNPNSRPRAEDLAATCSSMAASGVEPDAELWARIRRIRAELGAPW